MGDFYTELGARFHHDHEEFPDFGASLQAIGRSPDWASAADDPRWDEAIEDSMSEVLGLLGDDIGVPAIVFDGQYGYFGPVISPAPTGEAALALLRQLRQPGGPTRNLGGQAGADGRPGLRPPAVGESHRFRLDSHVFSSNHRHSWRRSDGICSGKRPLGQRVET